MSDTSNYSNIVNFQANVITSGRYNHTSLEANILAIIVAKMDETIVEPTEALDVDIYLKELEKATGKKVNYQHVKDLSLNLRSITYFVKWGDVKGTDFENVFSTHNNRKDSDYVTFGCINKAEYIGNDGMLKIEVSKDMIPFFKNLKSNMTLYNLSDFLKLKSFYAKRLYWFFCRFRSTGIFMKSPEDLKYLFQIEDLYPEFYEFKRRVILPSVKEINNVTNFEVTFEVRKNGKKVDMLIFKFTEKEKPKVEAQVVKELAQPKDTIQSDAVSDILMHPEEPIKGKRLLFVRCNELGMTHEEIETIFKNFTYKAITKVLYEVSINGQNKLAYAKKLFQQERK